MRIGVPREVKDHEYRVGLTPAAVQEIVTAGHDVNIETGAGLGIGVTDEEWTAVGATVVDSADDAWSVDIVVKVKEPVPSEYHLLDRPGTIFTFLHLAADRPLTDALIASNVTAIAYETVQPEDTQRLPLLAPMSEVAGRMSAQVAAHLLEREQGGRGILMGGVTGAPAAKVVIVGGGVAGQSAAIVAAGMGAEVTVLEVDLERVRHLVESSNGRIRSVPSNTGTIFGLLPTADVLIGAVLVPGARAPKVVSAQHIHSMPTGSVAVDIAIDQGGCFATSHMTTHSDPTYLVDEVIHYCVGNIPGAVPRTSTYALVNVTLPYLMQMLKNGVGGALRTDVGLARGVNVRHGAVTNAGVAQAHDLPLHDISSTSRVH
jgi:alanine dehydrogenase